MINTSKIMSLYKIVECQFRQNGCFPYVQINNLSEHLTKYSRFVFNKETDEYMNLLNVDDVNKLILMGADFTQNSKLFEWALQKDLVEIAKLLMRFNINIIINNDRALEIASESGSISMVKLLICHGANVSTNNNSPLKLASGMIQLEQEVWGIEDPDFYSFYENNYFQIIKILVQNGSDITANNNYAIGKVSKKNQLEAIKFLIECGADVSANNNYAIRHATKLSSFYYEPTIETRLNVLRILIENGANISANNDQPIKNIFKMSNFKMTKFLIEYGVDVSANDNYAIKHITEFKYSRYCANSTERLNIIKILIENGADIKNNQQIKNIFRNGDINMIKFLIEYGIDVSANDNYAIRHITKFKHNYSYRDNSEKLNIIKILIENGADIKANNNQPIKNIFKNCDIKIIESLIDYGLENYADIN